MPSIPEYLKLPAAMVDNSHAISPDSPGYFAEDTIELTLLSEAEVPWVDYKICISEHFGTHLDAPRHFAGIDASSVDQIPAEKLIGHLAVVDVRAQTDDDCDYELGVDDLTDWEATHGTIPRDSIVAMRSGWQHRWPDPVAYRNVVDGQHRFPGFSREAVEWLLEQRDILGIGVDTLSIDRGSSVGFEVHHAILGQGRWALENLTGLDRVPAVGGLMIVGPMKHVGGSGSPARVYTLFND